MRFIYLLLLSLLSILWPVQASDILQCQNAKGQLIFTDQKRLCVSHIQEKSLSANNLMSSQHVEIDVNYRIRQREYKRYENSDWLIYYEASMYEGDPVLLRHALQKLDKYLNEVQGLLPTSAIARLKTVDFYLLWGKASPNGGKSSGLRYLRDKESERQTNIDPAWNESVVIFSAKNFMYLKPQWARHVLIHELAHAWHIQERWLYNNEIKATAKQAENKKLYHLLRDENNKVLIKAYAMKNYFEYFAEMSVMYFARSNYFPFDRDGLKKHDPAAYALMQQVWPK